MQPPQLIISFSATEVFSTIKRPCHDVTWPLKSLQRLEVEQEEESNFHSPDIHNSRCNVISKIG